MTESMLEPEHEEESQNAENHQQDEESHDTDTQRAVAEIVDLIISSPRNVTERMSSLLKSYPVTRPSATKVFVEDLASAGKTFRKVMQEFRSYQVDQIIVIQHHRTTIPVDPFATLRMSDRKRPSAVNKSSFVDIVGRRTERALNSMGLKWRYVSVDTALGIFAEHLREPVRSRLGWAQTQPDRQGSRMSASVPPGMLQFTVNSVNSGLRIRYSPAYLFRGGTVFGSPSTPVHGYLPPGRYIFGGESHAHPLIWDTGIWLIPPAKKADLVAI